MFFDIIFYTIFNTHESLYTVPGASPADDVGMLLKCRQFTCVVFAAVLQIPAPITKEQL